MATTSLPEGWTIERTLEAVPNPNFGTNYGNNYFTRWTYICTDAEDNYVCSSGSEQDCFAQALSMAQSHTQGGSA